MIRENVSSNGSLDTDAFLAARLAYLNTPDRDTCLSPAQVVFGKAIKEFLPASPGKFKIHPEWRLTMEQREEALARRHAARKEDLSEHTKSLLPLDVGMVVAVQNQAGNKPKSWSRSGLIVEVRNNDQYLVKLDGSGRATLRNRRYLRRILPYTSSLDRAGLSPAPSPCSSTLKTPASAAAPTQPATLHPEAPSPPSLRLSARNRAAPQRLMAGGFLGLQLTSRTCLQSQGGGGPSGVC